MKQLNSTNDFKNAIQRGICLIDFDTPWCAPCISQKSIVEKLADHYQGKIMIAEMNLDDHQDIADTLGIRNIPTLIIFKDNKEVKRFIGLQSESTLADILEKLAASG